MSIAKEECSDLKKNREISFTWSPDSDDFIIDRTKIQFVFGIEASIPSFQQFLTLFAETDKPLVLKLFDSVIADEDPEPIKVSIVNNKGSHNFTVISVKKITDSFIAGVLKPVFSLPGRDDLASFFQQIFENQHHGIVITDEATQIVACNSYFEKSTGYRIEELIGKKTAIFNAGKHGQFFFKSMWEKINKRGYWSGLILTKNKSGQIKPQELLIQRLISSDHSVYYFGMTLDLSNKPYRIAGIEHGGIELLTQLPGEDEFFSTMQDELSELQPHQGVLVASFVPNFEDDVDIEYKQQLAGALATHERGYAAGFIKKAVFTLLIVYQRETNKPHSLSIHEAIRARFTKIKHSVAPEVYRQVMTCSIGVSVLGLDANNENKLISHSLQAMYERHSQNNNNICFFNRNLHNKLKRREMLEDIVVSAVELKTVEIFFQPIICSHQWMVTKLEALCRFRDFSGALLDTEEMIKIAEDMNVISSLDLVIAEKAMGYRDQLVKQFGQQIELAINISTSIATPDTSFIHNLIKLCEKNIRHLPYVCIELKDPEVAHSDNSAYESLLELRDKGLKIAVDNFGIGCSSFPYLKDGRIDLLKFNRGFIADIDIGSHSYHIVKMITRLAHALHIDVVVQGVETPKQASILKDLDVDYMQGFYFEHPQPLSALSAREISKKVYVQGEVEDKKESVALIQSPPMLQPDSTLQKVKDIFDSSEYTVLPVVLDHMCVGVLTKEIFNLHVTSSLGTDRETMKDYHSLTKVVSAMMETSMTVVPSSINAGEIYQKIRARNYPLPWVVTNESGRYIGIIDTESLIYYLNDQ